MKVSRLRPVYAEVGTRWGRWLCVNKSGRCDICYKGKSIYRHTQILLTWLGFGVAWGLDVDANGNEYIRDDNLAKRIWVGCIQVYS